MKDVTKRCSSGALTWRIEHGFFWRERSTVTADVAAPTGQSHRSDKDCVTLPLPCVATVRAATTLPLHGLKCFGSLRKCSGAFPHFNMGRQGMPLIKRCLLGWRCRPWEKGEGPTTSSTKWARASMAKQLLHTTNTTARPPSATTTTTQPGQPGRRADVPSGDGQRRPSTVR